MGYGTIEMCVFHVAALETTKQRVGTIVAPFSNSVE